MIQRSNQKYRRGKTLNGWRLARFYGVDFHGRRVYTAARTRPSRRYERGVEALVVVAGNARVVDKSNIVPEEYEGTWRSWRAMLNRCGELGRPSGDGSYVRRGVLVDTRWCPADYSWPALQEAFYGFLGVVGVRPDGKSIDRIDPYGHYVPGNVRWADAVTQASNKRRVCA